MGSSGLFKVLFSTALADGTKAGRELGRFVSRKSISRADEVASPGRAAVSLGCPRSVGADGCSCCECWTQAGVSSALSSSGVHRKLFVQASSASVSRPGPLQLPWVHSTSELWEVLDGAAASPGRLGEAGVGPS